jgi:glycosyltransferase involved in cell wall biosynthesis
VDHDSLKIKRPADVRRLSVAFTERHGMAKELSQFPPPGVEYSFIKPLPAARRLVRSSIKGYLGHYGSEGQDLIEAILSPILTKSKWIYSLANFQEATAFNLMGCPLPRSVRVAYLEYLLSKNNFKKLIFWSNAGRDTLSNYGGINNKSMHDKVAVVYPAIREVPDELIRFGSRDANILFSGDFFRKGGVNVVDAFERAQRIFPGIKLRLCCDEKDFCTTDNALKAEYWDKVQRNSAIITGRVNRDELIKDILPQTDIYLLPTYAEAFGFAILEAMAYGIPVISTNYFAIPEMIEHNVTGFLIDTKKFDCDKLFKGYVVGGIPADFRDHVTESLFQYLCQLIESVELRAEFGRAGLAVARNKFSFAFRNQTMAEIYHEALG